jgi:hypothetical protein
MENWYGIATLIVTDPVANYVENENLMEANRELEDMVRTLQKSTFDYFGKLLSSEPALK